MSSIKDIPMVMVLLIFLFSHTDVHVCTDSHATTKNFEIDGLPNFHNTQIVNTEKSSGNLNF